MNVKHVTCIPGPLEPLPGHLHAPSPSGLRQRNLVPRAEDGGPTGGKPCIPESVLGEKLPFLDFKCEKTNASEK